MTLQTERLLLRPWRESDAESLYESAKDPRVGPAAGWPPHKSVEESLGIIRTIFAGEGVFAVTLKGEDTAIGCIGLSRGAGSNFPIGEDEAELGYWIAVPYWGRGLIPEAAREILRHGFEELGLKTIWCGYYDGNEQSRRVQQKCGFLHHRTETGKLCPALNELRTEHICRLSREEWPSEK